MIVRQFLSWVRTAPAGERAEATRALARAYLISDLSKDDSPAEATPWREALLHHRPIRGRLLSMEREGEMPRTFSVSASPIVDEKGISRGILASFEDVTNLEKKKQELTQMVDFLRASSDAIKEIGRAHV